MRLPISLATILAIGVAVSAQQPKPAPSPAAKAAPAKAGPAPTLVLETAKGTIEIETYPEERRRPSQHIVELVKKNFYNGHALPSRRAELPRSRSATRSRATCRREAWWGRGPGSGKPIGVAEITKKRRHVPGAVAMAHVGDRRSSPTASSTSCIAAASRASTASTPSSARSSSGMDVVEEDAEGRHSQEGFREGVSSGCSAGASPAPSDPGTLDELCAGIRPAASVRAASSGSPRWPPTWPRSGCWRRDTPS